MTPEAKKNITTNNHKSREKVGEQFIKFYVAEKYFSSSSIIFLPPLGWLAPPKLGTTVIQHIFLQLFVDMQM